MSGANRRNLSERVLEAAETLLADEKQVSVHDILLSIGWLDPNSARRWRQGQLECLEEAMQVRPERISEAMKIFRAWAAEKGLVASETAYLAKTPQHQPLRFSKSGNPTVEMSYRTHWLSGALPQSQRERLVEKASRVPELVVIAPLNKEWRCHRCGGTWDLLMMENAGPACLRCVGLEDLEYLPAGNAQLTRRAKAGSPRHAVVVRFSRSRKRYERQGLLVEPRALQEAQGEVTGKAP